ncbi:MAG: hypothetical protein A2Y14_00165 [Verrucomicrobia bacterium GWF2_51_19]|nr:MAG: hypothetical protein A2Y14_00165 [Verrucomicrobia bacterium GWF2_51_19]HCJ11661.1 NAD(P)-dependent oxidoreductase [Opitutae bacterium]
MRVGITGANGFLGQLLTQALSQTDATLLPFEGDICELAAVRTWVQNSQLDALFHLAAKVPITEVNQNPLQAYAVNVGGTLNLMQSLEGLPKKPWFFYASTSHVYKSKDGPLSEDDPIAPISLYGKTKYMGESVVYDVAPQLNIAACVGRIFSFFHKTQTKPFLYPTLLERVQTEDLSKPFKLYGSECIRDFLNAEAVVQIMIALMERRATGIINIGSGVGVRIRDFVQQVAGRPLFIEPADAKHDALVANIHRLNTILS